MRLPAVKAGAREEWLPRAPVSEGLVSPPANDQMALGLIHAFRMAGLDVPRDISVVGFDDIPESSHFWPPLTTVRQDFGSLGARCVAMLLDAISREAGPAAPEASISPVVEPQLIIRDSVASV